MRVAIQSASVSARLPAASVGAARYRRAMRLAGRHLALATAAAVLLVAALAAAVGSAGGSAAQRAGTYSAPWRLDGERRPASKRVPILWRAGGYACEWRFLRATASETRRSVTIRVLVRHEPMEEGEYCAAVVAGGRAVVRLERRLGKRRLRHAPVTLPRS